MSLLELSPARCVRALSVNSSCSLCSDSCPTSAITLLGRLPSINQSLCVGCAGCVSVCPSEALALDDFTPTEFFFSFISDDEAVVSCQKNIPCIAALSVEHLISLCSLKNGLVLDIGHCSSCDIGDKVLAVMEERIQSANYLLEAIEAEKSVVCEKIGYSNTEAEEPKDRRDFFKTFHLRGIAKAKHDFEKEVQSTTDEFVEVKLDSSHNQELRAKKITDRRKLFFTALKRVEKPLQFHIVDASMIGFTSQKIMDEAKCTACQMCYRVCPTAALTSDMRNSKIDFDPFLCVKCHLCHDVCESDAIRVSTSYNLKEWFEPKVQNLITFSVRRCDECDGLFSSVGGEKICRRCQMEEEEALELWGLNK
ncbi:MAG: 4Fe-4S binding protein [Sulfuricurvum sp.]|uniref:4Fe-4S binding protein n=1 Tax=Sulfuricurvum sp. TaxID=2025608 RepID=UPI002735D5D0|nr:4Fe-4S binding protein [Sulfuricurvum sp.]MDP2849455.1 4Fe-4S binding protein [Sulfuricurvum sp.]